jgi:REP element-mobilizing transposase RayT
VGISSFGKADKSLDRPQINLQQWKTWREDVAKALRFPPVEMTGVQARGVGSGFADACQKSGFAIWACSILPQHVHLVIARHRYKVEQICNLLKGEATKELKARFIHPQARFAGTNGKLPSMWSERQWKVYLDTEESVENAIRYVEENPVKEGKSPQTWSFVRQFTGIEKAGWTVYH